MKYEFDGKELERQDKKFEDAIAVLIVISLLLGASIVALFFTLDFFA
jgi:hypothetical protein